MRARIVWKMAVAALLATAAACDDDGGTGAVQPATVAAASAAAQDGTAGVAAPVAPVVRVSDSRGRPVAGVPVTFAVTQGGGTVEASGVLTGADGSATAGTWTLGRTAGQNVVSATVAGFPAVTFTARALAGTAAFLVPSAGDDQSAMAGRAVAVAPAVRVTDAYGNAVTGVPVSFSVAGGGGAVSGGTSTTDAGGIAAVSRWSLGAPGLNTLTASLGSLRTTFSATALDPCTVSAAYSFGETASGELDAFDCRLAGGQRVDFFSLTLAETRSFTASMQGNNTAFLYLFDASGRVVAAEPNRGTAGAQVRVLAAPAAAYFLGASASGTSEGPVLPGGYTLRTAAAENDVSGCAQPWLIGPITTSQQLTTADNCFVASRYGDVFRIYLRAGQSITIRQQSSVFDTILWLLDANGGVVAFNDDYDGLNSRITYTATATGSYLVYAASFGGFSTGAYTLSVQ